MLNPHFALLGGALSLLGGASYIRDILRGESQPNRVSWLLWGVATTMVGVAQIREGVGLQWLLSLAIGLGDFAVIAASFVSRAGVWKLGLFDYACGVASLAGLTLWAVTNDATIAIVSFILADAMACIPTLVKSWSTPTSESIAPYACTMVGAIVTLATVTTWSSGAVAFSLWIAGINGVFVVLIRRRPLTTV